MKRLLNYSAILSLLLFLAPQAQSQTLVPGDIAMLGHHTDAPDGFTWIALTDIPAGEVIYFTEDGWCEAGPAWYVGPNEGHIMWTAPGGGTPCGTITNIDETATPNVFAVTGSGTAVIGTGTWNLSGGDQIIAYQSSTGPKPAAPSFIAAVHGDYNAGDYNGTTTWNNGASCINTSSSGVPTGLTNGVNCVSLFPAPGPEFDNAKYNGTLTGTSTVLRAAINNPVNWTSSDTPLSILPSAYPAPAVTCVSPCTDPGVPSITASSNPICPGASTTLDWTGTAPGDATNWHIYTSSCGVGQVANPGIGTFTYNTGALASTTTFYIRGEDGAGCIDESSTPCGTITITVQDITNPTITCPGNQTGNVDGTCNFTLPDYTGLATVGDNCNPSPSVTQAPLPGTIVGVGTTNVVLTADDGAGNTANCNFNVVVSDNTNPTITCPGNQVGSVDGSCNFFLPDYTGLATPADNCPGVVVTQFPLAGTNVGDGTTIVVLTATDANSNTANCNFNVVVSDNTNPTITCPGNQVGSVDGSCNFTIPDYTALATPADNCPGVVVTQAPLPGTTVGVGTTNIVLTATDGGSNTANCNFDVVVSDITNPTITCPGNQVGTVDGSCNFTLPDYTALATPADNCPGVVVTQAPLPGTIVGVGTTNIVLTATDANSNTANCNFNVVVSDNTNPTITCPGNQVGSVDGSCNFTIPDYTALATPADNCPGFVVTQAPLPGTTVGVGTTNIVLTATDANSNTANCNFNVVVSDATAPIAVCQNINAYLDGAGNVTITAGDIDGGSTDNCAGITLGASQTAFTCANIGPNSVTLTVTDASTNTDFCVAVVTVIDTISPVISCPGNQTETPDASCNFTLPDYTGLTTPSDNCGATTVTQSPIPGTVISGNTTLTMTADDGNGNTSTCTFDVIISDVTPPTVVCQNITVFLDGAGNASIVAADVDGGSTDNCAGLVLSASPTSFTCANIGANTVTLTGTDGNSNSANCVATVTVLDTISPVAVCQNITVFLDGAGNATIVAADVDGGSTDNCGAVTLSASPTSFTCADIGSNTVTLTATDGSSNTANCIAVVTVVDTISPVAVCQNITVFLDGAGNVTITPTDLDGGSTDNCGAVTFSASATSFTCADIGSNNVTLTAIDGSSNTANCTATVTVVDSISPTAVCQNITVFLDGAGNATITAADLDGGSTDNCGSVTLSASTTSFTCADLGSNSVTLTVTDGSANSAFCVSTVTVVDTISPTITCPGNQNETFDASCQFTLPDYTSLATAFDNCSGSPTVTQSPIAGTVITGTTTITLTADDGNGNTSFCTFNVIATDGLAPTAVCQDITIYLDGAGTASIVAADIDGGSFDNCGAVTLSASQTTFTCADEGTTPANDMIITGVGDGPLTGGTPKFIEVYVVNNIADLSQYGLGSANNGGGTDGEEFTFPAVSATAGQFIYVASEAVQFTNFMGFAPDYTNGAAPLINGDDAVELFFMGSVIDVFGDINVDGTGQPWDYLDGWAYRNDNTGPDGSAWTIGNWSFSGINVFDGQTTNATSPVPFPTGSFAFAAGGAQVTLTVTDGSSNIATCIANISVLDTISPTVTCPGNQADFFDATCSFTLPDYTGLVTAADNCNPAPTVTQSPIAGTVVTANTTITMTSDDGNGNTSTCTFDVTLTDNTAPTITCPGDQSENLDASCQFTLLDYTGLATAADNCNPAPTVTQSPIAGTIISANTTITLTADDGNGNTADCTFDVLVTDAIAPTITCPGNQADFFDATCAFTVPDYTGLATAADNCNPSPTITQSPLAGSTQTADFSVTLTADDGNGNTTPCTFNVTLTDSTAPTATCPGNQTENFDASCNFTLPDYTSLVSVSDNCDASPTVTQSPPASTVISGNQTITMTVMDASGNTSTCTFDVIPNDAIAPVIVCPADQADFYDGTCSFTVPDYTTLGSATDNCGIPTITQSPLAGTTQTANFTVTLTASDGANTDFCTFNVTLTDTAAPVVTCPGPQTGNADASCMFVLLDYTSMGTVTDACDASPVLTQNPAAGTMVGSGITQVWLIGTDATGNMDSCSFDVTVTDVTAPTFVCLSDDIATADANCETLLLDYTGALVVSDNCDASPVVTQSPAAGTIISGSGTITPVWLYATDASGNVDSCTFNVTLMDLTAPSIACPLNDTVFADASCQNTLADYTAMATVSDNCDASPVVTQSPAAGMTLTGSGSITAVTLYATDADGNVDSCSFDVLLLDNTAPTIACPMNDTLNVTNGCDTTLADYSAMVTVSDNCDASPVVTQSPAAGSLISGGGNHTVTMYATDADGNVDSCSFDVVIVDLIAPVISCLADTTVCDTIFNFVLPTATDNCTGATVTQIAGLGSGAVYPVGTTTNTFVAMDAAGNTDTCSFTVTVLGSFQEADAGFDVTICGTDNVNMTANAASGGNVGTWTTIAGGGTFADVNDATSLVSAIPIGTNVYVWSIGNGICSSSDTVNVTVGIVPDATFTYVNNGSGLVTFTPNYQSGTATYFWEFDNLGISNVMVDSFVFSNVGSYNICLTITENGCTNKYCETINITTSMLELNNATNFNIYPNPFAQSTNITYTLGNAANVQLMVLDLAGREVALMQNGQQAAGEYNFQFNSASNAPESGVYLVRLVVDGQTYVQRVIELR